MIQWQQTAHKQRIAPYCDSWGASPVTWWQTISLQGRRCRRPRVDPWVEKIPWSSSWEPSQVFLPGDSHGQRGLVGYSPRGQKESDTTKVTEHAQMCRLCLLDSSIEFRQQHHSCCPFCSPSLARFYSMTKYQLTNPFLCEDVSVLWETEVLLSAF